MTSPSSQPSPHVDAMTSIGAADLARVEQTVRTATVVAIASTLLATGGMIAAFSGAPAAVMATVVTVLITLAIVAVAVAVNARMVRTVGRRHGWRRESSDCEMVGRGKQARIEITFAGSRLVYRPVGAMSNSSKLTGQPQLDVAGEEGGRILVRIPGDTAIRIFRPANW